jgi:very-short-patch-repair endonuclease
LRKTPSRAERALWNLVRDRGVGAKFRRQHPIPPYTADFACVDAKLVVEVDGPSHSIAEEIERDAHRTRALAQAGWRVLRFNESEVLSEPSGVLKRVAAALAPSP